jgi:hypothetical protein
VLGGIALAAVRGANARAVDGALAPPVRCKGARERSGGRPPLGGIPRPRFCPLPSLPAPPAVGLSIITIN